MSLPNSLLLALVISEAIAIAILAIALSLTRQVAAMRAVRLREALQQLAHAKNVLLMKEAPLGELEKMLVDAGVLRRNGVESERKRS